MFKIPWPKLSRLLLEVSMYYFSTCFHYVTGLHKYIVVLKHVPELFRRRCNTKGTLPTGSSWSKDISKAFLSTRQVLQWIHNIVAQFCIHLQSASWDVFFMGWNNVDSDINASNWNPLICELIPPWQDRSWSKVKTFWATATDFMVLAENDIVKGCPHIGFQNYVGKWLALLSNSQIQL